jgi:putative transposase
VTERLTLIEPGHTLSVRRQCHVLRINRSSVYRGPATDDEEDLLIMKELDKLHMEFPFYGSRKLRLELRKSGRNINRKHVQRLMRLMDIAALVPQPNTSAPRKENPKLPYLLRQLAIVRPNQVWASDITYIPTKTGFCYLVAVMDWYSRRVLSWRISNTLDTAFCVEAVKEALLNFGCPCIFNTDQGSQFTDTTFTGLLLGHGIKVSMDGKGRFMDNIFVERLWRSVKYEEVYLNEYDNLAQARTGISRYMALYNDRRSHQSLGYQTPAAFYNFELSKAA